MQAEKTVEQVRKFPASAYEAIDPAYELLDNGLLQHRESGVMRPKLYSDLPIPFKTGQSVRVVDGNSQFPLGSIYKVGLIEGGVVYVDGVQRVRDGKTSTFNQVAICWERLDPASSH